jgi:hypothetical protein
MKMKLQCLFGLLAMLASVHQAAAQGTAFTYQGQLSANGAPANGSYDLAFTLYDSTNIPGNVIAGPLTNAATAVSNGLFAVTLNFGGGIFTGANYWLDISVSPAGSNTFTGLSPRQQLTHTPYAIFANTASNVSGTLPAGQLSGVVGNSQLANNSITVGAGTGLGGGGTVPLGGSTTLTNAGVLSVTGNADITVSTVGGAVTLGDTATSANTASAIVARDGSGNFSAGSLTLAGNLNLPATTTSAGIIYSGGSTLLQTYGTNNFFAGVQAGNLSLGGMGGNTGVGFQALMTDTTGCANTAGGAFTLNSNTTGGQNTAIGFEALGNNTSGSNNVALGYEAGSNIATGSYNIDIGNPGAAGDGNIIRIGTPGTQTNAFIAGQIIGDGSGLTNLSTSQFTSGTISAAQLPGAVITNYAVNATLSGTFAGDGSGLTNIPDSGLQVPPITNNQTGVTLGGTVVSSIIVGTNASPVTACETICAPSGNGIPYALAIFGDPPYYWIFNAGGAGVETDSYLEMDGNAYVDFIPDANDDVLTIGLDVPHGVVLYSDPTWQPLEIFCQDGGGTSTDVNYPNGLQTVQWFGNGNLNFYRLREINPGVMLQINQVDAYYTNTFGMDVVKGTMVLGYVGNSPTNTGTSARIANPLKIDTNGNVIAGSTNLSLGPYTGFSHISSGTTSSNGVTFLNGSSLLEGGGEPGGQLTLFGANGLTLSGNGNGVTVSDFVSGNGSGLTNTFNGTTNATIPIAWTGVTNTATQYGVAMLTATSATFTIYDGAGNSLCTNSTTGSSPALLAIPLGPNAAITASSGLTGYLIFP